MTARLAQYWLLWQAALSFTRSFSRHLLLLAALFVTLVAALVIRATGSAHAWLGWALCIPAGFLLFTWTLAYLPGAFKLNSPANAQLVPGMRRRLIELSLLVWLTGIGAMAAGMHLVTAMPGPALWLTAVITLGTATMAAGVSLAWLLYLPLLAGLIANRFLPVWLLAAVQDVTMSRLALLLLPLLGALAAVAMFPQAGQRHWHRFARQSGAGAFASSMILAQVPGGGSLDGMLLRRAVARRAQGALLMLALGRSLPAALASGLAAGALATGALIYLASRGVLPLTTDYFQGLSWGMIAGILLFLVFQASMAPTWLARSIGEQALVRLAPALPSSPAAFNGLLARAQLRQLLAIWLMATGVVFLQGIISGMPDDVLLQQAGVCCMTLPALALALRNHASSTSWPVFGRCAVALGVSCVGPLAGIVANALLELPFWPVALMTACGLSVVLVRQRMRLMRAAPIAFPAGRMA